MFLRALRRTLCNVFMGSILVWTQIETSQAASCGFQPLAQALSGLLGTTKVAKKNVPQEGTAVSEVYYSKDAQGKADKIAVIEKGLFEPNCTHTWAIGIDKASGKATDVRMVEMSCPHAHPICVGWFQDQFKGVGPAEVVPLEKNVKTVAKATYSAKLQATAVRRAVTAFQKIKGQI